MQFLETVMSSELDRELVNKTTNILSILSKKDALTIFLLVKNGLKAETNTPQKVGLTRKQYYTRLKQLVDSGLIDKSGDEYIHTTLGSFVHQKHVLELFEHTKNVKQMKMVDTLKRTKQFSEDDITNFLGKIAGKSLATSASPQVRFVSSYEEMVSDVIEQVEFSKTEIMLASRFQNDLVINKMLQKADSGINVKIIVDKEIMRNYIQEAGQKLQLRDKNSTERITIAANPYYPRSPNVGRRLGNVPFCLLVVDRKRVALEIIDRFDSNKFKYAFFINDEIFAKEAATIFDSWWVGTEEDNPDNIQKLFEETVTSKSRI